jgi:hypothetical protein
VTTQAGINLGTDGIEMRIWQTRPIVFTALIGALSGSAIAIIFLLTDPLRPLSTRLLLCLFPASIFGFGFNGGSVAFSIFLTLVEVGTNAFLYACAFAAPVVVVIAIRRQFGTPEAPTSITGG